MSIKYRIILSLLGVSLITIILSWFVYDSFSKSVIEERLYAHLSSVSVLKENQIVGYTSGIRTEIEHVATIDAISAYMEKQYFSSERVTLSDTDTITARINAIFNGGPFVDLFVLSSTGKVVIALDKSKIGVVKDSATYFSEGKKGLYIQNFYHDNDTGRTLISASFPTYDAAHSVVTGVVVGLINLDEINSIMSERSGLGETGETYLVNKLGNIVAGLRSETDVSAKVVSSPEVNGCLSGSSSFGVYKNYNDVTVVGSYTWMPEIEACLFAELRTSEAFASLNQLINRMIIIMLGFAVFSTLFGLYLARSIYLPISALAKGVGEFSGNSGKAALSFSTTGEVGVLAAAFNKMSVDLHDSRKKLEELNVNLEKLVAQRTKQLEEKNQELEKFNGFMMGREKQIIE